MRRIEILGRIASSLRYRSRRTFLKGGLAWVAALPFFPTLAESARSSPISQPKTPSHQAFMKQALEMRTQALDAGDQGYGAVVVKNEKIVGLTTKAGLIYPWLPGFQSRQDVCPDPCKRSGTFWMRIRRWSPNRY
jgi:hypothetical protein